MESLILLTKKLTSDIAGHMFHNVIPTRPGHKAEPPNTDEQICIFSPNTVGKKNLTSNTDLTESQIK